MSSETATVQQVALEKDDVGNFSYPENHKFDAGYGLTKDTIDYISKVKDEPEWVNEFRHRALEIFESKPMPTNWATEDLNNIDFDAIRYYLSDGAKPKRSWDDVPPEVLETFDRLGVPEQERAFLAGVEAQYDSEAAYSNVKEALADEGVIFVTCSEGLKEHEEIFRPWFGKVIPTGDNKFSALNSAVMSGGSFIYIPPGVKVKHPLQAYFRINSENFGQFERTLIIADEGSEVMYMEGCTAPKFETATLHSAVVELVAMKDAKIQYITVQNWSSNVYNLVTKRGLAHENAEIRWIDCNIGSRLTMKYPGVVMKGERARGEVISIALANDDQHQDTGAKMIHAANNTTSNVVSKSISVGEGRSTYRGQVHIPKHLKGCKNNTECDALLINSKSRTDTYPAITVKGNQHVTQHEASVSQVSQDMLFYMQQRGLSEAQAMSLAVNGFVNDLVSEFPMEYSVELKRLIDLEMEGSVG
ncbi:MAG: Fe-S cluster assembly protein SufB [Akkermansiaceae bacterium]